MGSRRSLKLWKLLRVAPVAVVLLAGLAAEAEAKQCCFTNPGFTGTCQVAITKGEQCSAVLDYLNTPNSTGRSYCNNTEIRGGWSGVACPATEQAEGSATPTRPRTSMFNEKLVKSRRTPTPAADAATTTPAPTPAPSK